MSMLGNKKLASILGESQANTRPQERITTLKVSLLSAGRSQPRRYFDDAALRELAESIRTEGVLQPLIVRQAGSGYEIVMGERRWRAAQLAEVEEVPVIIRAYTDQEAAVVALVENLQREDLNVIDEVDGIIAVIARVLDLPGDQVPTRLQQLRRNPDPEQVASLVEVFRPLGQTWESFVVNKIKILNYSPQLLDALRAGLSLRLVSLIRRAPEEHHARLLSEAQAGKGFGEIKQQVEALSRPARVPLAKQVGTFLASKQLDRLSAAEREAVEFWLQQMPPALQAKLQELVTSQADEID